MKSPKASIQPYYQQQWLPPAQVDISSQLPRPFQKIRTTGGNDNHKGKLKGEMTSTVPLGSFRITGFIATKLMENGALSVFDHLATP
jgi:hypothetical protein